MGHAKPSTTESIYMHLFADDYSDEMGALGALPPRGQLPQRITLCRFAETAS